MSIMPRIAMIGWAKEIVLDAVDRDLHNLPERYRGTHDMEPDEVAELVKQRNRVAKLLGLPAKTQKELMP